MFACSEHDAGSANVTCCMEHMCNGGDFPPLPEARAGAERLPRGWNMPATVATVAAAALGTCVLAVAIVVTLRRAHRYDVLPRVAILF